MMLSRSFAIIVLALAVPALADDVILAGADGRSAGQRFDNVTIQRIEGDTLLFQLSNGNAASRPLSKILQINVTNDPGFTAGEQAFAAGDMAGAVDGYLKAIRTNDPWKIRRAAPRLIEAGGATKRFDAALAGYIAYAKVDPAAAAGSKPALPQRGSTFLDDGARQLDAAVRAATSDAERQALLALALDVQVARGDQAAAAAIADQLSRLSGAGANANPQLAQLATEVRLSQARLAIQSGHFADASTAIDSIASQLTEPRQQAEALFIRAQAQAGLAPAGDRNAKLDAAAAFMRIPALFASNEVEPFMSDALLQAAQLSFDAGDANDARQLCRQIAAEFPQATAATAAAALAQRIDAASPTTQPR